MLDPSAKPVANPVVVLREEFDDWAVLFNPDTAEALGINPVGVAVWRMLDGRRTVGDLVAGVREGFADVPEGAADDVIAFVADLMVRGFAGFELPNPG